MTLNTLFSALIYNSCTSTLHINQQHLKCLFSPTPKIWLGADRQMDKHIDRHTTTSYTTLA